MIRFLLLTTLLLSGCSSSQRLQVVCKSLVWEASVTYEKGGQE